MILRYHVCSTEKNLVVLSPTAPNSSYEEIDLNVVVEYSGPQLINSSVPLRFRYAGNPDINAINPRKIRNTFVYIFTIVIFTNRRSVAKRGGCFQRRLFVCQFVCLSAR